MLSLCSICEKGYHWPFSILLTSGRVALLGSLSRGKRILIPGQSRRFFPFSSVLCSTLGFYDQVRPRTEAEDELYRLLAKVTGKDATYLASKWREPSLTIHAIEASSPGSERSRLDDPLPNTLTPVSRSHCHSIPRTCTGIPSHSS